MATRSIPNANPSAQTLRYVQPDHLGSSTTLTDPSGNVVARERYSAFGERRRGEDAKALITDQLYTGQQYNSLSTLYHYSDRTSAGRFYDPLLGRFVQPDPILPNLASQGLNRYSLNYNNPLRYKDPNGNDPRDVINGAADFVGGFVAQVGYNFAPFLPTSGNLAPQPNESGWVAAGRVAGDVASIGVGMAEMAGGAGAMGGGAVVCGTGVLCAAGAPAVVGGAVIAGHGAVQAAAAATNVGNQLGILMMAGSQEDLKRGRASENDLLRSLGQQKNGKTLTQDIVDDTGGTKTVKFIPDFLNNRSRVVGEIKDRGYLYASSQIRAEIEWARANGYSFELHIRTDTTLSGPLQDLIDNNTFIQVYRDVP